MEYDNGKKLVFAFTFHNVSINSIAMTGVRMFTKEFTFHNVSINSDSYRLCDTCFNIYIPQCFY